MTILKELDGSGLTFWCPGCNSPHTIYHGGDQQPQWSWNNDLVRPTFSPSVLVKSGHYAYAQPRDKCWCNFDWSKYPATHPLKCGICHSFVENGKIRFLDDCTHELKGQTVDIPEWPWTHDSQL